MTPPVSSRSREHFLQEHAHHELRVLLLIQAMVEPPGGPGHVDFPDPLTTLDFLVRHPLLTTRVLDQMSPNDPRLHLEEADARSAESPMLRHRYGLGLELDHTVVGALLGRGLLIRSTDDPVRTTLWPSIQGTQVVRSAANTSAWSTVFDRCRAVAEATRGHSHDHIAGLIRKRLSLDQGHDFGDLIT